MAHQKGPRAAISVLDTGASGRGEQDDTVAIQSAIDQCASNGGGLVMFLSGTYLTGTLFLKSQVFLHVGPGGTILGQPSLDAYPPLEPASGMAGGQALIYAADAEGVGIIGPGTIDGQGGAFPAGAEALDASYETEHPSEERRARPLLMRFERCHKVRLRDVTLRDAGCFAVRAYGCQDLIVEGLTIHNRANVNADGLQVRACRDVVISNCSLSCGDDAIAIYESGHNVVIANCNISSRWAGIRIGPHSEGHFSNISASNCTFYDTFGCAIKLQMAEGGVMENLSFSDLVMENVTGPISVRLSGWLGWEGERRQSLPLGQLSNVRFHNIRATVAPAPHPNDIEVPPFAGELRSCISITGQPGHPVEGLTFSEVHITFPGGGTEREATQRHVPDLPDDYPEYFMFGILPAYGLYAHHARDLTLRGVRFDVATPDLRPAIVCDDVGALELAGVCVAGHPQAESAIRLQQVTGAYVHGCHLSASARAFVRVEGDVSQGITLTGNDLRGAAKDLERVSEVAPDRDAGA